MMISVVIPTIDGREALCERTLAGFRATAGDHDLQIILAKNRPTIGKAWNDGADAADGDYLMLAADDIIPHPGWADAAIEAVEWGYYPAPRIDTADGGVLATGSMGGGWLVTDAGDYAPVASSQFPFMDRDAWEDIGPALEIHYFADDHLAARARAASYVVCYREGYRLTHLEGTVGRAEMQQRAMTDRLTFEQALASELWRKAPA